MTSVALVEAGFLFKAAVMPIATVQPNDGAGDGSPSASAVPDEVPVWLAARRERQANETTDTSASRIQPPPLKAPPRVARLKVETESFAVAATSEKKKMSPASQNWLVGWLSRQSLIGILVSLAVHATVLLVLAFIVISHAKSRDVINLWGVVGNADDAGDEMILDTSLPVDAGESAPLQMADMSQTMESLGQGANIAESMRVGSGGTGNGEGDSGTGVSMGVASLKIPRYAQTKGSFSAWADPRDPKPGENYFIVIQFNLPRNVKKYRGSDLSGEVNGTDSYQQQIRFKAGEQFPVEDGAVQIRIPVPGAAKLVRDKIRVESKLLREKQEFEIEF